MKHEKSEGRWLVSGLIFPPDPLILNLGSVYRASEVRDTLDVKCEPDDAADWISER